MTNSFDGDTAVSVANVLNGESVPEDHIRIQRWIGDDLERAARIDLLYRMWNVRIDRGAQGDVVAFSARLRNVIDAQSRKPYRRFTTGMPGTLARYVLRAIVAILLVVAGLGLGQTLSNRSVRDQVSVYSTANGQRATVTLLDGSTVMLNVASRIEIPADYANGNRNVKLSGEAMFDVNHHGKRPFVVMTGGTRTTVLGTQFVVRRYRQDTTSTIVVRTGKVMVDTVIVGAGEQVVAGASRISAPTAADEHAFTFVSGAMVLGETTLGEALHRLNRWYDAEVVLGDAKIANYPFKGTLRSGSVADLVEILQLAFDVRVVRNGRSLTLYSK